MTLKFNLLNEPWLPCIRADGVPVELSLQETLGQAHTLRELQGETPLVTAALHRLLLAILHRVFGPESRKDWRQLWRAGRWDETALAAYFAQWRSRFDLLDVDYPFYQVAKPVGKPKPLNTLALEWASGNNSSLFDHTLDRHPPTIVAAYAARLVVTLQTFHLAGLAGGGLPNFTDTPWARGVIFLAEGNNLFETLAFNLIGYRTIFPSQPTDCPIWERDNSFHPNREIPTGYLDYLTWPSRRLKLAAENKDGQIIITQAWLAPGLTLAQEMTVYDPMKAYRRDAKKGWLFLRFNEARALWRHSDTLFQLNDDNGRSPAAFAWLANLLDEAGLDPSTIYRYMALGMANDQSKVEFYRHERIPLPLAMLADEELVEALQQALSEAESVGKILYYAGKELAIWLVSPNNKEKAYRGDYEPILNRLNLERRYWARLEVPFRQFIQELPRAKDAARATWRELIINTAREIFIQAAHSIADPTRGLKAVVLARQQLERGLKKFKIVPSPEILVEGVPEV
jgi:CRISPR system Cascade subunit CasA